jgi:hypothetical protein
VLSVSNDILRCEFVCDGTWRLLLPISTSTLTKSYHRGDRWVQTRSPLASSLLTCPRRDQWWGVSMERRNGATIGTQQIKKLDSYMHGLAFFDLFLNAIDTRFSTFFCLDLVVDYLACLPPYPYKCAHHTRIDCSVFDKKYIPSDQKRCRWLRIIFVLSFNKLSDTFVRSCNKLSDTFCTK